MKTYPSPQTYSLLSLFDLCLPTAVDPNRFIYLYNNGETSLEIVLNKKHYNIPVNSTLVFPFTDNTKIASVEGTVKVFKGYTDLRSIEKLPVQNEKSHRKMLL